MGLCCSLDMSCPELCCCGALLMALCCCCKRQQQPQHVTEVHHVHHAPAPQPFFGQPYPQQQRHGY